MKALSRTVMRLASCYWRGLASEVSLDCLKKAESGDFEGIARMSIDPRAYLHWEAYARDCAAVSFLKKFKNLPSRQPLRQNAISKWWEGERQCYSTNERLTRFLPEFYQDSEEDSRIYEIISLIRKEVRNLIGARPPTLLEGRFGPGATFVDRGLSTTIAHKMTSDPALTRGAIWFLPSWLETKWGKYHARSASANLQFVPGNRFTTVPKTCLTDRAIAVEPSINVFYQLSLGSALKARLKERGWDLKEAQDVHRQVACESSVSREFATLDLSNASDTVARVLVKLLLPPAWYEVLDMLRSTRTLIDGKWVVLEKFSSMGNGYTFELETVIFSAIANVVSRLCGYDGRLGKDVYVFGDDIIVKDDVASSVVAVLEFLGFSLNREKSFWGKVPFRESCGGDFFEGRAVRGFYLKGDPDTPEKLISVANGIRKVGFQLGLTYNDLLPSWFSVLDELPSAIRRCRGPEELGDIVIHDTPDKWSMYRLEDVRYLRVYRPCTYRKVHLARFDEDIQLATILYGARLTSDFALIPRDGVTGYKVGWVPYS